MKSQKGISKKRAFRNESPRRNENINDEIFRMISFLCMIDDNDTTENCVNHIGLISGMKTLNPANN